ncbi:MAG: MFS transporter [Hamadaea sp.]|nr:MFS transporter [Hamadaea sp.]
MPGLASLAADRRPLGVPAFRRLWLASIVSAIGGSFATIAVPAQLFRMSGSSSAVGTASTIMLVTLVISALWSGVLADRVDRRRLLLAAHLLLVAAYLCLSVTRSIPLVYALVAVEGLAFGAVMTAMGAAVPRVVPTELLAAASSLSSLVRNTGAVVGPLLAGALIPITGLGPLFLCDAVALLAVVWAVWRLPPMPPPTRPDRAPMLHDILDGFVYLGRKRLLLAIIAVDLAAMVFGLPVALFPELADRVYGGGAVLGLLFAAYPAGVFTAGLLSGSFTRARRHGALMAGAALAWGATVIVLGVAGTAWLALLALYAGGAVNFVLSTFRNAISQAYTDDALRGRIQGAMTVVLVGGPQLAGLLHGYGGALVGARLAVAVGGVLTVVAVLAVLRLVPQLWGYDAATHAAPAEADKQPVG